MNSAPGYEQLKDAIARVYPDLSTQLQSIARFALERPNDLALGTVAGIAEAVGAQPSALIRFANALDFGGFSEMQQVFRGRLLERSGSYRERINRLRREAEPADRAAGVLHQFVGEAFIELGQLEESVRAVDVDAAVKLICRAKRVHVLAQRRAFPVACYLAYALSQLEVTTYLLDGVAGMLTESLRGIAPEDVFVVASFHQYSQDVVDAAAVAHKRRVPVIAITDSALSPLKPSARVCFELGRGSDSSFRSLVGPLCLAQALVIGAGHALTEQAAAARHKNPKRSVRAKLNGAHP